jgi:hypothetical protein
VSAVERKEGAATVANSVGPAQEEKRGREASGPTGEKLGQQAESEEGRGREKNLLFFFQYNFPNSFSNGFESF